MIAWVSAPEARVVVLREAEHGGTRVRFCRDGPEFAAALGKGGERPAVVELTPGAESEVPGMGAAVRGRGRPTALLVRVDLARSPAGQIAALGTHLPAAAISVHGLDDLGEDISRLVRAREGEESGLGPMVERLLSCRSGRPADAVAVALAAGRRRIGVAACARAAGVALRTFETWCAAAGATPERLLGGALALHSLWRLDVLGWPPGRVARVGGFSGVDAWAKYVLRHAGRRPGSLLKVGGFRGLLEAVAARWGPDGPAPPPPGG